MLKPSYAELMDVLNKDSDQRVTSRYSVVIASSKRARQIIDGDEPMIENYTEGKPLSTAVEEIYEGKVKIVPEGEGTVLHLHNKLDKKEQEELKSAIVGELSNADDVDAIEAEEPDDDEEPDDTEDLDSTEDSEDTEDSEE